MKVLVIGSGGREHALAWALARSTSVREVACAPGNPGTAKLCRNLPVPSLDGDVLVPLVRAGGYDLVVVGPETPLAAGLADRLRGEGAAVFGPGAAGARLESSKAFAKDFMARHRIPTARHATVTRSSEAEAILGAWGAPIVVKASGLAAGKGVTVAESVAEAREAIRACLEAGAFGAAGATVVLEEKLEGEEASLFAVTDGDRHVLLPAAQDHKRAFDGDLGPNTGGMGAYSPAPVLDTAALAAVERSIIAPTLDGLRAEGIDYRGLLYAGLMMTADGPRVIEFNCRFGDPETQAVLPRLGGDLAALLHGAAGGRLDVAPFGAAAGAAACVVVATGNYPASGEKGLPISGVEEAEAAGALVFHAGTALDGSRLVTAGGRVMNVVGTGPTLRMALGVAYAGAERIRFPGARYRRDIGARALERSRE